VDMNVRTNMRTQRSTNRSTDLGSCVELVLNYLLFDPDSFPPFSPPLLSLLSSSCSCSVSNSVNRAKIGNSSLYLKTRLLIEIFGVSEICP
jgi:hypothetical protein